VDRDLCAFAKFCGGYGVMVGFAVLILYVNLNAVAMFGLSPKF
jgi:hypothetical protein